MKLSSENFIRVFDWKNGEPYSYHFTEKAWQEHLKNIKQKREDIKKCLMTVFSEDEAIEIIYMITTGKIKHVKINY